MQSAAEHRFRGHRDEVMHMVGVLVDQMWVGGHGHGARVLTTDGGNNAEVLTIGFRENW